MCALSCMWGMGPESSAREALETFASNASPLSSRRRLCVPLVSRSASQSLGRPVVGVAESQEEFTD